MKVCIIQSDPSHRMMNLNSLRWAIEQLPADLYVLPELFTIGMQEQFRNWPVGAQPFPDGPLFREILAFLRNRGCAVVCGLLEQEGSHFYNIAAVIGDGWADRYRQKYPARASTGRVLPVETGDYRKVTLAWSCNIGLMVCHDYFAAAEFFQEYKQRGVQSIILIADSHTKEWLRTFPDLCRKYELPVIVCNNAGAGKGGSCMLDRGGNLATLQTANGGVFDYLPEMMLAAVGTVETSARLGISR